MGLQHMQMIAQHMDKMNAQEKMKNLQQFERNTSTIYEYEKPRFLVNRLTFQSIYFHSFVKVEILPTLMGLI